MQKRYLVKQDLTYRNVEYKVGQYITLDPDKHQGLFKRGFLEYCPVDLKEPKLTEPVQKPVKEVEKVNNETEKTVDPCVIDLEHTKILKDVEKVKKKVKK